jgi:hypothetical protein
MEVDVLQRVVAHVSMETMAVALRSALTNPSPNSVILRLIRRGALRLTAFVSTGASKLSVRRPVPTTLPTVIIDVPASTTTVGLRQVTVVEDVHADVPQTASDTAAVAERS